MKNELLKELVRASYGYPSEINHVPPSLVDAVGLSGVKFCETQKLIREEASTFRLETSTPAKISESEIAPGFSGHEKRDPAGCQLAIEEFDSLIDLDAHHSCGLK